MHSPPWACGDKQRRQNSHPTENISFYLQFVLHSRSVDGTVWLHKGILNKLLHFFFHQLRDQISILFCRWGEPEMLFLILSIPAKICAQTTKSRRRRTKVIKHDELSIGHMHIQFKKKKKPAAAAVHTIDDDDERTNEHKKVSKHTHAQLLLDGQPYTNERHLKNGGH